VLALVFNWKKVARNICENADLILPNSEAEWRCLVAQLDVTHNRYKGVPIGVSAALSGSDVALSGRVKRVLVVGRIEPRKNCIGILDAFISANLEDHVLVFIGAASHHNDSYVKLFESKLSSNVVWLQHMPQIELFEFIRESTVVVLASFFETFGLTAIEGNMLGCNVVMTDRTHKFLKEPTYCDPYDTASIANALKFACLSQWALEPLHQQYTWSNAATLTGEGYCRAIER
jgi:glycosyltransferase involved in cell wall biosynthesis